MIAPVLAVTSSGRASSPKEPPADAETAHAPLAVRPRYVGATFSGMAGAGVEGFTIVTVGGDVFAGARLSRWVSLEGFFAYHFATRPSTEVGGGGWCLGSSTDTWHWEVLGARLWVHLLHLRALDLSIGPTLAGGMSVDRRKSTSPPSNEPWSCYHPLVVSVGGAFDVGVDFSIELRPVRWLGLRATFETSVDVGGTSNADAQFGAASISGWVGPVFRF